MSSLIDQADLLEPETQRSGWDVFAGLSADIEHELSKAIIATPVLDSGARAAAEATLAEREARFWRYGR